MRGLEDMKFVRNMDPTRPNTIRENVTRKCVTRKVDVKKTNGITCANACLTMEEHKHESERALSFRQGNVCQDRC